MESYRAFYHNNSANAPMSGSDTPGNENKDGKLQERGPNFQMVFFEFQKCLALYTPKGYTQHLIF